MPTLCRRTIYSIVFCQSSLHPSPRVYRLPNHRQKQRGKHNEQRDARWTSWREACCWARWRPGWPRALGGAGTGQRDMRIDKWVNVGGDCECAHLLGRTGKNATASAQGKFAAPSPSARTRRPIRGPPTSPVRSARTPGGRHGHGQPRRRQARPPMPPVRRLQEPGDGGNGDHDVALNLGSRTKPSFSPTTSASNVAATGSHNSRQTFSAAPTWTRGRSKPILVWANGNPEHGHERLRRRKHRAGRHRFPER